MRCQDLAASSERYTPSKVPATSTFGSEGARASARTAWPERPAGIQVRPPSALRKTPPPAAASRVQEDANSTLPSRGSTTMAVITASRRELARPMSAQCPPESLEPKMCPSAVPRKIREGRDGSAARERTSPPGRAKRAPVLCLRRCGSAQQQQDDFENIPHDGIQIPGISHGDRTHCTGDCSACIREISRPVLGSAGETPALQKPSVLDQSEISRITRRVFVRNGG